MQVNFSTPSYNLNNKTSFGSDRYFTECTGEYYNSLSNKQKIVYDTGLYRGIDIGVKRGKEEVLGEGGPEKLKNYKKDVADYERKLNFYKRDNEKLETEIKTVRRGTEGLKAFYLTKIEKLETEKDKLKQEKDEAYDKGYSTGLAVGSSSNSSYIPGL